MEFLKRLFGGKAQEGGLEPAAVREKDNIGTRVETESQLDAHWWKRQTSQQFDPFVQYVFDRELDARNALLGLDCIHAAADSGRLISTEVLVFGYPRCDDGKWYALVCGRDLSYDLWLAAKVSFEKHGGTLIRDLEPQTSKEAKTTPTSAAAPAKPEFVREERKRNMEVTMVYRIYRAPDAASAKAFLSGQPEPQQYHYIVVETPEGNYGRDIQGIYQE